MICRSLAACTVWMTLLAFSSLARSADETPKTGLPQATPGEVGMTEESLFKLTQQMKQAVKEGQAAGVVTLVTRNGRVVHLAAVGRADIEANRPMQPDTIFAIASMTKPITGAALMILQDEGKLSLDDPVSKYIPQFKQATVGDKPLEHEITLRHLATHTSGLSGDQQNMGSLEETAEKLAKRPLSFQPGERWQYSPGMSVLGRVVEVVSGKAFEDFLDERIFKPLRMNDTTFFPTPEQQQRIARLYQPGDEPKSLKLADHWLMNPSKSSPNPSGGLFSKAADLARFYQMILNGGELDGARILSKQAVETLTTVQSGEVTTGFTPGNGWGVGWCVVREPQAVTGMLSPGSCGHGGAFGTQGWIDPQRNMAFALLIQRTNFGNSDGSDLRKTFQQRAVQAIAN